MLFIIGFTWINTELVSLRSRGKATTAQGTAIFKPKKGDIILCNWSSWVDVLVLLVAFNPTFVRPIISPRSSDQQPSAKTSSADRRRQGAAARGQQHHSSTAQPSATRVSPTSEERLVGWKAVSFIDMVFTAAIPPASKEINDARPLEDLLREAPSPLVIFPEVS
jgi:hypothetical protein